LSSYFVGEVEMARLEEEEERKMGCGRTGVMKRKRKVVVNRREENEEERERGKI
jgi:hypothetical protein